MISGHFNARQVLGPLGGSAPAMLNVDDRYYDYESIGIGAARKF
jgi:hypothetical protein